MSMPKQERGRGRAGRGTPWRGVHRVSAGDGAGAAIIIRPLQKSQITHSICIIHADQSPVWDICVSFIDYPHLYRTIYILPIW